MNKLLKVLLFSMMVFCLTGCGEKEFLNSETFETTIKEKSYFTYDATENHEGVSKGMVAMSPDMMYQLEYYETADETSAVSLYDKIYQSATSTKASGDADTTEEDANYKKYTLTTANSYIVISRIENTIIYVNSSVDQKDNVNNVLTELGY